MVYLDNAATTYPKSEAVYKTLDEANRTLAFNSGRGSYKSAREATKTADSVREKLKKLVNAGPNSSVVFSSSITIALNQILNGIVFSDGDIVYVSPFEHNAVARVVRLLELKKKIVVRELPLQEDALELDVEKTKYLFSKEKPKCVCCSHVSNVTGYILPVDDIFKIAKKYNAITILDTAQSLGVVSVDSNKIDVDFIAFAGHKTLYGPFGIGGFINCKNMELEEFIVGGTGSDSLNLDMPKDNISRYESASANIVSIKGLETALSELNIEQQFSYENSLMEYLIEKLKNFDEVKLFLPPENKRTNIVSFVIEGYKSEDIGSILDEDFDIAVRTGYHCAPFIHKWLKDEEYLGTIRVGIGKYNTKEDIDKLINALEEILE